MLEQQQAVFNAANNTQDITVLAPSNNALSSLSATVVSRISSDLDCLAALLSYPSSTGRTTSHSSLRRPTPCISRMLLNSSFYSTVAGGQRVMSRRSAGAVDLYSGEENITLLQLTDYNFTGGTVRIIDVMLSYRQTSPTLSSARTSPLRWARSSMPDSRGFLTGKER